MEKPVVDDETGTPENGGEAHAQHPQPKRRSVLADPIRRGAKRVVYTEGSFGASVLKKAFPIGQQTNVVGGGFSRWLDEKAAAPNRREDGGPKVQPPKVGFWSLLSHSTTSERWCMAIGTLFAAVSGSSIPVWLLLLNHSLNTLMSIAVLISALSGGGVDGLTNLLTEQLTQLVIAFAFVGIISLISGSIYVALWTYTGERQALRIKEEFVKSAFNQDAEWFDKNNPEELPTKVANSMQNISDALGRKIADTFMNLWAALFCLVVSLWLDAPLALAMLCIVPVIALVYAIISVFIRKSSNKSSAAFNSAGAVATEAISGIKTIASLCAEHWTIDRYHTLGRDAQKASVYSGFLSSLTAGLTGLLFYLTITVAFLIGTEQVADSWSFECILDMVGLVEVDKRCYSGAAVMVRLVCFCL
jgi:ABC-type multidrug transport system fused ATPase/permease subunit